MSASATPPIDLSAVQALLEVAAQGSLQAAARALGMSRATLRRRLEALEESAGVPLLHRDPAGVRLTHAGEVFAERGRRVLAESFLALDDARNAATEASGLVRVAMPVGMQLQFVAELLGGLKAAGLDVRIDLRELQDPAVLDDGTVDLLFHFGPPPDREGWFSRALRQAPVQLVASAAYLETHGIPTSVDALLEHTLLLWQPPEGPSDQLPLRAGGAVRCRPWFVSPNINLLRRMAALGQGITLAPDGGIPDEPGVAALTPVLTDLVGRDEVLRVTTPLPGRADPRAAAFIAKVQAQFADFSLV